MQKVEYTAEEIRQNRLRLGRNIRTIRIERGMTQEQLAKAAHMSRPYVGSIENGKKGTTIGTIAQIAKALDVSISELVEGVE